MNSHTRASCFALAEFADMIKKFLSLRGIGRLEDFKACGDFEFKRYTLIFAENGIGRRHLATFQRNE